MKVLVTGAAGFVGRQVLASMPAGWEAIAVARAEPPAWAGEAPGSSWVAADLTRPGFERGLPGDVDAVLHLAQSRFDRSFPDGAVDVVDVNVSATARLLDHARAHGARRFVLASTATVYRQAAEPLTEDAELDCSSLYAASKRSAELLMRPYRDHLSCSAMRLFTTYGADQRGRLIAELVERVRERRPVHVAGERGLVLSPIHVSDVAEALRAAVAADAGGAEGYEVVNVGGTEALGIRELAGLIGDALGVEPAFEELGGPEPGGFVADRSRFERVLDVPTPLPFAEGIRLTVGAGSEAGRR